MKEFIKWQVFGRMGVSGRRKKKQKKHSLWFALAIFCMFFTITVFADSNINNRYEGCDYPISAEEAATFEQVEEAAEQFKMAYIRDDMTLFEKEMAIIEYLLVHVDYDGTFAESSHWAYSALIEGKAICDGYTKAFMELANVCGIETKYVLGNFVGGNSYNFNGGVIIGDFHTWNLVKLDDGEWYHVDVTFADGGSYYSKYNYDKNQLRASGEYDGYIEGLGPLWINYINYSDGLLELTGTHKWDNRINTANGYLYGPKVTDEYFMNGVIDLSLAKPEDQLNLTIKQEKINAHNQRTEEILADFAYVIPFTTWDETMSAAKSYLSATLLSNVRLAVKYENQEAYTNAQQGHSNSFTEELMKQAGPFKISKVGDWILVDKHLDYLPVDEQKPVYDIIYSYQFGTYGPSYDYDE